MKKRVNFKIKKRFIKTLKMKFKINLNNKIQKIQIQKFKNQKTIKKYYKKFKIKNILLLPEKRIKLNKLFKKDNLKNKMIIKNFLFNQLYKKFQFHQNL